MSYWDEHGFLHAQNGVHNSENAILFSLMHEHLSDIIVSKKARVMFFHRACPTKDHTPYKLSLDNMNAACCVYDIGHYYHDETGTVVLTPKQAIRELLKRIPWYVYARPDNFYTWSVCAKKHWLLRKLALPFASLMMIYSCYKVYDKKPRGEGKHRVYVKLLATSGKLQVWTRLKAVPMPITEKICNYFINRSPWNGWKAVFGVYFEANHPLNGFPKENYKL